MLWLGFLNPSPRIWSWLFWWRHDIGNTLKQKKTARLPMTQCWRILSFPWRHRWATFHISLQWIQLMKKQWAEKKILDLFSKGVHARDNDGWNGVLQPNVNQKPIFSKGVHARDHDGWNGLLLPYVNWKPIFKFNARNILFPPTNILSLCYWRTG